MNDPENVLLELVKTHLQGRTDPAEIERVAQAAGAMVGLPPESIRAVIERLRELAPQAATCAAPELPAHPRLMVDWGVEPKVGWETCPEFFLICPPAYSGKPVVEVTVDQRLDHALTLPRPLVNQEEQGCWTFHAPFGLTTQGANCRPGHYLVQLGVAFPDASPPLARYFSCKIRLTVLDPGANPGRTLEIDGDGQSILNLHGSDLSSFSRVVLKGGDRAVLNIQEPLGFLPQSRGDGAAGRDNKSPPASCKYEYKLKVDESRQRLMPRVSSGFHQRQPTDAAAMVLPSGQRILLLARRTTKLGRNRVNNIVTRFLPHSPENEQRSERISREHLTLELTEHGLRATDHDSPKGTVLSHEPLKGSRLLTGEQAVKEIDLELGPGRGADISFRMSLRLFAASSEQASADWLARQDWVYFDTLGIQPPRLWRLGQASQLDAMRLRRVNNLRDEQYVVVFREALVGSSEECPICITSPNIDARHAKILHLADCFWLENLADPHRCQVEDYDLPLRELVPLTFGATLKLAGTTIRFEEFHQMHL